MTSSPAPDLEPRTEAGRRFLEDLTKEHCSDPYGCHAADDSLAGMAVFAIEAEAAAESGRLREALRMLADDVEAVGDGPVLRFAATLTHLASYVAARRLLLATPPAPSDHGAGLDDRRQLFISLSAMCEAVAAVLGGATTLAALADCANVARGVLLDSPLSHSLAAPSPEETRP